MKTTCFLLLSLFFLTGCPKNKQNNSGQEGVAYDASSLELFQQGDRFGYRDITGIVAITPRFSEAGQFSEGLARVKPDPKGGWGYIDASGNEVISPQYEAAGNFVDGMSVVLNKGQFQYIGPDGSSLGMFEEEHPETPLSAGDTLFVVHPNGLIARTAADLSAAPTGQVHLDEAVIYASDSHTAQSEPRDGLRGNWIFVRFRNRSGYLFDLYLSRYPRIREHRPVERYQVIGSSFDNDEYAVYTLTKFASGGRVIVHEGPNWTESHEIVPETSLDQLVARVKLNPAGNVGSLVSLFDGTSRTFTTGKGDSVVVRILRNTGGFLENVTMAMKNEESFLDITMTRHGSDAAELATTVTTQPGESRSQPSNPF